MRLLLLGLLLTLSPVRLGAATDDPKAVALAGQAAFRTANAAALDEVAHPELKQRLRRTPLLRFYREQHQQSADLDKLSDKQVIAEFCAAYRAVMPNNPGIQWFEDYQKTEIRGEFAVVRFDAGWRSESGLSNHGPMDVVLKRSGGRWLFLWSTQLAPHVDLDWDPRTNLPP